MNLEVWVAILAGELQHDLHPPDKRDLSTDLDKAHARMDRIDSEHATEAERLSWHVMQISGVLVDLGMMPVQDIPQLSKWAREVLLAGDLILKHLQETLASSTSLWD
jgi:hypothetical protein